MERAIDKLCKAFSVEERSSYSIKSGDELILKLYWTPLTIADRDKINETLKALKSGDQDGGMDFAIQMLIQKAEDEAGSKLFQSGDRARIRNRLPMAVVIDIMAKMQGLEEVEEPDEIKSAASKG
jgi:hypothetical protein|tara:strand:- start:595 stop:969 length:375 start_codon:yes stop_codon:yes gene_type:complete